MRVTCLVSLVFLISIGGAARAQLLVYPQTIDAGIVKSGQVLTEPFGLMNSGRQPIEIIEAKSSCGCLKPKLPKYVLQPGEKCTLHLEVNSLAQPPGPVAWHAQLRYRVGDEIKETTATVMGQLIKEISVEPPALQLLTSKDLTATIVVSDNRGPGTIIKVVDGEPNKTTTVGDGRLRITSVQASTPHLETECAGESFMSSSGKVQTTGHCIKVTVTDAFPEGRHEEVVSIYTDDPAYPELRVPVTIVKNARQRVVATPSEVVLRGKLGQPVPARIVLLRDSEGQPVVIERIEPQDQGLSCSWAAGPDAMATVRLSPDCDLLLGNHISGILPEIRTAVHVHVSQPVKQIVTIPVQYHLE